MKKLILIVIMFGFSPVFATSFSKLVQEAEMWWCSECGLSYPASQKVCLNKDCPLFRKKR